MRFRANLTSVTNPRIEVHALLSRYHPSWKGLVEGTCRHRAGLQHRCSACEKLELCITSDKYNLFYQTTWFLRINPCVFRRLVNLVPDKRFKRNKTYPLMRFVPQKRFRWNKKADSLFRVREPALISTIYLTTLRRYNSFQETHNFITS